MMSFNDPHKKQFQTILKRIVRDRTFGTFLLALVFIVAMGSVRPNKPQGIHAKRFWAMKISWRDYADVVVTGDSRVLGGVSPAQMEKTLSNRRIVNYAFGLCNLYTAEYLEATEHVLDPNSRTKTIILGITPHSLTGNTDAESQFLELKHRSKREIFIDRHLAALFDFFDYMSFRDVLLGVFPHLVKSHTRREFCADGWLAYSKHPPGKKKELKTYRRKYEKYQVSPAVIENLLDYVSQWTGSGIRVYAFLVPTCQEMVELEKEMSGFNQSQFVAAFKKAGGMWIDIDPAAYDSFDGSHLQSESALKFSSDLASRIYEIEQQSCKISLGYDVVGFSLITRITDRNYGI